MPARKRNPCEANVKNRKLLAKIACGRSGRPCIVSGQSYEVRAILCSRHRAKEARRYQVAIAPKDNELPIWIGLPVTNGDFLEGL
jgi:hypothetical protein